MEESSIRYIKNNVIFKQVNGLPNFFESFWMHQGNPHIERNMCVLIETLTLDLEIRMNNLIITYLLNWS